MYNELGRAINHQISIKASNNNGFIVNIGCGTFTYTNVDDCIAGIRRYMNDPKGAENRYIEACHNKACNDITTQVVGANGATGTGRPRGNDAVSGRNSPPSQRDLGLEVAETDLA